jgi:hypothetical protein
MVAHRRARVALLLLLGRVYVNGRLQVGPHALLGQLDGLVEGALQEVWEMLPGVPLHRIDGIDVDAQDG